MTNSPSIWPLAAAQAAKKISWINQQARRWLAAAQAARTSEFPVAMGTLVMAMILIVAATRTRR
tara:strand:- start:321 stop:512 length:192 start_codon:yes stop_codon:yes gene_type:complete